MVVDRPPWTTATSQTARWSTRSGRNPRTSTPGTDGSDSGSIRGPVTTTNRTSRAAARTNGTASSTRSSNAPPTPHPPTVTTHHRASGRAPRPADGDDASPLVRVVPERGPQRRAGLRRRRLEPGHVPRVVEVLGGPA